MNNSEGAGDLRGARLIVVTMSINQPRVQRRLRYLCSLGADVVVYAFDRQVYEASSYLSDMNVTVNLVGRIGGRLKGFRDFLVLGAGFFRVLASELFRKKDFIYYFGFPPVLMDSLFGSAIRVYEVSDLRFSSRDISVSGRFQCFLEDRFLNRLDVLVSTSPGFIGEFAKRVPAIRGKAVLLENGIPAEVDQIWQRPQEKLEWNRRLRFGFVGLIRYLNVFLPFLEVVASRAEEFEVHIFGDGYELDEVNKLCSKHENLSYHGKFSNPDHLPGIYSQMDLSLSIYDNNNHNVQLALPNKLYESVFFGVPLVVASGTALAERVEEWGVGYVVNPRDSSWVGGFLDGIDREGLRQKHKRCLMVPREHLGVDMKMLGMAMLEARG